jgi:hypothetical protein
LFRRYLLGELDETEQEALEKELLTSDEQFQEFLIAEDELVDDYCAGELGASEEQEYHQRFLTTPERRRQHRFGAALRKHLSTPEVAAPSPGPARRDFASRWRLPLAAAAVAILATGVWSILQTQRSPFRLEESAGAVEGSTVAFFLTTGGLRSPQIETRQTINVPVGVGRVELQLDLPTDRTGEHEVTLERDGAILAEGTLPARTLEGQWVVVASVPAELLDSGDYRVVLRAPSAGGEGGVLGTYTFRVTGR